MGHDLKIFIQCAEQIEAQQANVKWFISSDSDMVIQEMRKKFGRKIISAKGRIAHVSSNKNGYERVLIDLDLLSKCNEIIMTGGSTFGFVASIKALKYAYIVNGKISIDKCFKFSFSGPHFSLRPDNNATVF